jgi:hypothetical protein
MNYIINGISFQVYYSELAGDLFIFGSMEGKEWRVFQSWIIL